MQNNPPPPMHGGLPPTMTSADALAAARMPPGDEYEEIREQVRLTLQHINSHTSINFCFVDGLSTEHGYYPPFQRIRGTLKRKREEIKKPNDLFDIR
jgi:hypothetical protein